MSFFHLSSKAVSRSDGRSAVASAAYRSASDLYDERDGKRHSYSDKQGVIHASIMLPAGAPDELSDRGKLWNAAEAAERRKDARTARELEFALPSGLPDDVNIALARMFVHEAAVARYGVAADVCIHKNLGNIHCHAMLTTRTVGPGGLGEKVRALDHKPVIMQQREVLAVRMNQAMARHGLSDRVDHRSYRARGLRIEPTIKLGPVAAKMESEGQPSDRMAKFRAISHGNGARIIADPTIALDVLTEGRSTFDGYDIARLASRCSDDEEQFRHVVAAIRAHADFVAVGKDVDGNERYSTRRMVEIEKEMARHAAALVSGDGHGLPWLASRRLLKATTLGPEQQEAVKHIVGKQGLALVAGLAGTGKSRMLGTAREAWEESGRRVMGAAVSGIAAESLQEGSGIESRTIASLEYAWAQGKETLAKGDVLVVDEAGMVGSDQMRRLLSVAKNTGAKVVLIGDAEQLQPIAAGSAFRSLAEKHGVAHLSAVRRQRSAWMREATKEFATDRASDAIARYEAAGMVHEAETRDEAREKLVAMWAHDREQRPDRTSIIMTHTRAEVRELNYLARGAMRASGALGGDDVELATEHGARSFAVGDRVLFTRNDRDLSVKNGQVGTVREVSPDRMAVQLDDGTRAAGGRTVAFRPSAYAHLEHGYAVTIHKAQGVTVRNAYVLATPGMDRTIGYVAMTRHTQRAEMVYARDDFRAGFAGLAQRLGRDGRKDTTLDYREDAIMAVKPRMSNVAHEETDFQRRLREVRERRQTDAMRQVQKETAPETDFQRRLREVRAQRHADAMRQSASQKF